MDGPGDYQTKSVKERQVSYIWNYMRNMRNLKEIPI